MTKTLVVIGATGRQGGSVVQAVLKSLPSYKIRAITRDPSKEGSKKLEALGCEVVKADSSDAESLKKAFTGADALYYITNVVPKPGVEFVEGKSIADAAVAAGIPLIVFSSLPSAEKISGGKYKVPHFDDKYEVEQYVRSLNVKSAFIWPGFFAQNFEAMLRPQPLGDGTFAIFSCISGDAKIPVVDIGHEMGNFVTEILSNPEKYDGKTFLAAGGLYTFDEMAKELSKSTGKTVLYKQVPESEYMTGFGMPEELREEMVKMFLFIQDFNFAGPQTESLVVEGQSVLSERPNSLADYLATNPINLQ
uniref:ARAD1D06160p n=1 Tax=Blastobotrys adeninivorans TaxID=409370 RepID=A0A060TED1_BLAAD